MIDQGDCGQAWTASSTSSVVPSAHVKWLGDAVVEERDVLLFASDDTGGEDEGWLTLATLTTGGVNDAFTIDKWNHNCNKKQDIHAGDEQA